MGPTKMHVNPIFEIGPVEPRFSEWLVFEVTAPSLTQLLLKVAERAVHYGGWPMQQEVTSVPQEQCCAAGALLEQDAVGVSCLGDLRPMHLEKHKC